MVPHSKRMKKVGGRVQVLNEQTNKYSKIVYRDITNSNGKKIRNRM